MQQIDFKALIQLKSIRDRLSPQQYKTLRGQVLAGDPDGAMKGLRKILRRCSDEVDLDEEL
jgi:hypothetical protein